MKCECCKKNDATFKYTVNDKHVCVDCYQKAVSNELDSWNKVFDIVYK